MKYPNIVSVEEVIASASCCATEIRTPDGHARWVPARGLAPSWLRWRATWLVFTGRADALTWPGQ